MTSSIRTNPIQTSNLQFNQQQPILQQQPIQQQQFVNLQTNQQNPQLKGQIPPQQYNQNQVFPLLFSNQISEMWYTLTRTGVPSLDDDYMIE